jgi:hypothetical protein
MLEREGKRERERELRVRECFMLPREEEGERERDLEYAQNCYFYFLKE